MSAASRREQQLAVGGVYHPRQQVEVNENGVWIPAQIQNVANFTVRNSITRGEINILFGGRRNRSRRNKKTNKKRSVRKKSRSKRSVIKTNKKSKKPKKRSVKKY
jgi:hypothetical protein